MFSLHFQQSLKPFCIFILTTLPLFGPLQFFYLLHELYEQLVRESASFTIELLHPFWNKNDSHIFCRLPITFFTTLAVEFAINITNLLFHEHLFEIYGIWVNRALTTACHSKSCSSIDHLEKQTALISHTHITAKITSPLPERIMIAECCLTPNMTRSQ